MMINELSPGAVALRAKIAATLLETLGPEAIDGDRAGALAQKAVVMLSAGSASAGAAGAAGAAAPDPEALAASFSEFLEASVARDFTAWLLDHVGKHASDYGFFGEAAGQEGVATGEEEQRADAGDTAAAPAAAPAAPAAAAAANVENVSEQSIRGGRGRGGFARGGAGRFAGRGRGRGLGVSRGGGGGAAAAAGVSKASSSSRSVFDRLGAGAAGAAADAAAEAASGGGGDSAMTAADAAGAATATTTATTGAADDPARLRALREELVRLRQEAIKGVAAAPTASAAAPDISSLAAGRTVLVKNVHFDATDASLAEHFRVAGLAVERATVARAGAGRGPSKGYGVVLLLSVEAARRALALAGSTLEGRAIDVVPARPTGIALEEGVVAASGVGGGFRGRGRASGGGFRGGRGGRRGGRGGRFSSSSASHSSFSYVRPELAAERAAEAAAARRAALDAEMDAFARGKGG